MADSVSKRLVEHPDFIQLVRRTAASRSLPIEWVEKDYWVVRVLHALVDDARLTGQFLFKGGTSLSKAFRLIDRFSEDVDILLTGPDYGPLPAAKGTREKLLTIVRDVVEARTSLQWIRQDNRTREAWQYFYFRNDYQLKVRYPLPGRKTAPGSESTEWVLVEAGFRGGSNPHRVTSITSYVADYVAANPPSDPTFATDYAPDLEPVQVPALAPERTFVEKLLALHTGAQGDLGSLHSRHYYDVCQLFDRCEGVTDLFADPELFKELLADAVNVSNRFWNAALDPRSLRLSQSPALVLPAEIRTDLGPKWKADSNLYPNEQPSLENILARVAALRIALMAIGL